MNINKRMIAGLIFLLLILSFFSWFPVPTVAGDGASTTEEVYIEWRYPSYIGMTTTAGAGSSLEGVTWMNVFNVTGTVIDVDYSNLTIYSMQGYIHSDDADDREVRAYAYDWLANNDAGAKFGESVETWLETPTGSYSWKGGVLNTPIVLNDDRIFFYGIYAISEGGSYTLAHPAAGGYFVYENSLPSDPFFEVSSGANAYSIRFAVDGDYNTTTTHNLYYGGVTNYTARRDVNYTAPVGATARQLQVTYPVDEYLVNITRSNGGAYDETLSTSDYTDASLNATHNVLTLGDATISLYGWDYRIFTASYPSLYSLTGPTFENGTRDYRGINVTATMTSGSETFNLNGTDIRGYNNTVLLFSWPLSGGGTRLFYPRENYETIIVYIPEDDYAIYSFDIKDYSGKIGDQDSYVEAFRYISGTRQIIERAIIQNAATDVPLVLVYSQAYLIRVYLSDDTIYSFGYFIAGLDTTPVIIVSSISFSDQVQASQAYMLFEATRSTNGTVIQVEYEDERNMTSGIYMEIRHLNHSVAYSDSAVDTWQVQFQWNSAVNETDYYVWARAVTPEPPTYMGNVTYNWPLSGVATQVSTPFDIGFAVGNTTIMSSTSLVPVGLTLAISVTSSVVWTPLGLFVTIILSAIMASLGWVSYSGTLLTAAMCFAFIFGIYVAKKELNK